MSELRNVWDDFYEQHPPSTTAQQFLDRAAEIDAKYGSQFNPPVDASGNVVDTTGSDPVTSTKISNSSAADDLGRWADDGGVPASESTGTDETGSWEFPTTETSASSEGGDMTAAAEPQGSGTSFFDGTFEGNWQEVWVCWEL